MREARCPWITAERQQDGSENPPEPVQKHTVMSLAQRLALRYRQLIPGVLNADPLLGHPWIAGQAGAGHVALWREHLVHRGAHRLRHANRPRLRHRRPWTRPGAGRRRRGHTWALDD